MSRQFRTLFRKASADGRHYEICKYHLSTCKACPLPQIQRNITNSHSERLHLSHVLSAAADLDVIRLARFLRRVEDGYLPNPYHNKTHAADVLQSQFMLLTAGGLGRRAADPLVLLAAMLSAIIHDLDHKGVNNDFLIRQGHELAIVYNGGPLPQFFYILSKLAAM